MNEENVKRFFLGNKNPSVIGQIYINVGVKRRKGVGSSDAGVVVLVIQSKCLPPAFDTDDKQEVQNKN